MPPAPESSPRFVQWNQIGTHVFAHGTFTSESDTMGRYLLLWVIGVPIPILLLIWLFGGLN
jgi:hypothetical protein